MKKNVWKHALAPLLLSAVLLSGCSGLGGKETGKDAQPETLKVMYWDESSFFDQYGMLFSAIHPEVEIEVVSTQNAMQYEPGKDMDAEMLKFIEKEKPDILMLEPKNYTKMAGEGKLLELDTKVEEKSFEKEGIMPGMLDYMKELSGGKLYGLVPNFYSQVVYYNKDLFQKHGVDLPKDKMSWDDLLRLAARFPTTGSKADRVYGLKPSYMGRDLFQLGSTIGLSSNLNYLNTTTMQVTINTDAWKKAFETAVTAWKSGSIYQEEQNTMGGGPYEEYLMQDPFIAGKAAMTMDGNYYMNQIKQAQDVVKDKTVVKNWDMVTMPVDPSNPDYSTNVSLSNIFAIPADSPKSKVAWTFLEYVMSDEYARVTSKRQYGQMSVRTQYLKDKEGHHMEAFYSLKPMQPTMYENYQKIPQEFFGRFNALAQQELKDVADNKKSLSEALDSLQKKGQEALIQAKQKEDAKPKESQGASSASTSG